MGISLNTLIIMISCKRNIPYQIMGPLQVFEVDSNINSLSGDEAPILSPELGRGRGRVGRRARNRLASGGALPSDFLHPSPSQPGNKRQPRLSRLLLLCYKYIMYIQNMTLKYHSVLQKRY